MTKPYMIHCCAGTGGLFLTSVFAQVLGYPVHANFSKSGHAHDLGKGNWRGANSVCFIGDHWDINYQNNYPLYYTHQIPKDFQKNISGVNLVYVHTDPADYHKVTELYVKKAWPDIWNENEYKKWASPNYPPFDPTNIPDSELIVNDLINDLKHSSVAKWHEENASAYRNYQINFKTIMGLDNNDLVDYVSDIVGRSANSSTRNYVQQYQQLNKKLYFNEYV
jgi:hypothetical protein